MARKKSPSSPAPATDLAAAVAQMEARLLAPMAEDPEPTVEEAKPLPRPDISQLPPAVDGTTPLFGVGDRIVIERSATILPRGGYLDTRTYRVVAMDTSNGNLRLYDEGLNQWAAGNWITGPRAGQVYKLAVGNTVTTKRKRGRPRKNPIVAAPAQTPTATDGTPVVKRGRGRPKGVKNRSKAVIVAERAQKQKLRAAKRAAKAAGAKPAKKRVVRGGR